jgi:hypothetical protein
MTTPADPPSLPVWSESFPVEQGTFLGRILDPVRAAALQAAVAMIPHVTIASAAERITLNVDPEQVVSHAERFEAYLDPPEEP